MDNKDHMCVVVCGEGFPAFDVVSDKYVKGSVCLEVSLWECGVECFAQSSATAMVRAGGIHMR